MKSEMGWRRKSLPLCSSGRIKLFIIISNFYLFLYCLGVEFSSPGRNMNIKQVNYLVGIRWHLPASVSLLSLPPFQFYHTTQWQREIPLKLIQFVKTSLRKIFFKKFKYKLGTQVNIENSNSWHLRHSGPFFCNFFSQSTRNASLEMLPNGNLMFLFHLELLKLPAIVNIHRGHASKGPGSSNFIIITVNPPLNIDDRIMEWDWRVTSDYLAFLFFPLYK